MESNEFLDIVEKRQSTRTYMDKPISFESIERCIEAARLAPSACNSQPWTFHVISEPGMRQRVAKATLQKGLALNKFSLDVPVLVVLTVNKGNLRTKIGQTISGLPYYLIDVGIAAEHFCLQATEEGLGTCLIGWFQEKKIKEVIHLRNQERIALVIALGYSDETIKRQKTRKSLEEIMVVYK